MGNTKLMMESSNDVIVIIVENGDTNSNPGQS